MTPLPLTSLRLACCLAAIATLAAGCTAPPEPEPLVIGILAATTGADATSGADAVSGAQLAVDVVNGSYPSLPIPLAAGTGLPNLGGATLILARGDTGARTDQAAVKATALIDERHAVGVLVSDSTEVTAATASQMQRLRIPLIDAHSTADYLTELGMDWYFRTGPGDRSLAESAFALLRQRPHGAAAQGIAIVAEAGGDSTAASARLADLASRAGSAIVAREMTRDDPDDAGLVARLGGGSPNAIFAWAHSAAGATAIARSAGRVAGSPPLFGLGPGFQQLQRPPATSPALMRAMPWSAEFAQRSPAGKAVLKLYKERYERAMTGAAADAFTAVITLAVAIDAAGSGDPAAIRTALRQTSLPATQMIMPWNGLRFGSDGQNHLAAAVMEEWDNRSFRLVYPAELASGPVRWSRP